MKKVGLVLAIAFLVFSSFGLHKFYTAIYQIEFVPKKKMIQITTRIFIDDLNEALEKKYKQKVFIATKNESPQDTELIKKYFAEKFQIKVNGKVKPMNFVSKEVEENVVICYLSIKEISKIKMLEIENSKHHSSQFQWPKTQFAFNF
jgi:GTP:adenosylcobinamide-phosphate guanylyltransferase